MDPAAPNPLLRSFERHLRAENRSAQTVATYLIALRQAETFLTATRGTTLAEASRADLEAYLGDLLTRRAAATAATYYKVLKLLYQWLEDQELPASPMAKMRPPIIPDQPVPSDPRRRAAPASGRLRRQGLRGPPGHGHDHAAG
jgi:site-specific recombinase XerD